MPRIWRQAASGPKTPAEQSKALAPVDRLKVVLAAPSVQEQFENALAEGRNLFVASLIDLYGSDSGLQACDPGAVVREALKAAVLKLPINRSLGFAWIVPYKGAPQFQLGYKGYVQLAMRTGHYRVINADLVYEGELRGTDRLTGLIDLTGERKSDKVAGYFAYIETVNGFRKAIYWPRDRVEAHAKRYSPAFGVKEGPWQANFDSMAIKTMLRLLLSKYGLLSVELQRALEHDQDEEDDLAQEVLANANREVIDVESRVVPDKPKPPTQTAPISQPTAPQETADGRQARPLDLPAFFDEPSRKGPGA